MVMLLEVTRPGGTLLLILDGRLDGAGATDLDTALRNNLEDDDRAVVVDMGQVSYLSSAGIRVLLMMKKEMKRRNGLLALAGIREFPRNVLETAGFLSIFDLHPTVESALLACSRATGSQPLLEDIPQPGLSQEGISIRHQRGTPGRAVLTVSGSLEDVVYSRLTKEKVRPRRFSGLSFALGLGALEETVEKALPVLGEMVTVHGALIWEPTDGSGVPDYFIPVKDTGAVHAWTGFSVGLSGPFHDYFILESEDPAGVTLAGLYTLLFAFARRNRPEFHGIIAVSLWGVTAGIASSGLLRAPILDNSPPDGGSIFDPGNVKDWISVSPDPAYQGSTLVGFGFGIDRSADLSHYDRSLLENLVFTHPENTGSSGMDLHNHGVIFQNIPWDPEGDLQQQVRRLVFEGDFVDMRHLLDSSRIRRAKVGVAYIDAIVRDSS
jgi:anti-anti-sigma factor